MIDRHTIGLSPFPSRMRTPALRTTFIPVTNLGTYWSPLPFATKFIVSPLSVIPMNVGRLAHRSLFPSYLGLVVRVRFSVPRPNRAWVGAYSDPTSPLFNSFFGNYEVEWSKTHSRPFGFHSNGSILMDEVARLGSADWGFFSAHCFGGRVATELLNGSSTPSPGRPLIVEGSEPFKEFDVLKTMPTACTSPLRFPNPFQLMWKATFGLRPSAWEEVSSIRMRSSGIIGFFETSSSFRTIVIGGALRDDVFTDVLADSLLTQYRTFLSVQG
jgi:hypothetical protein